jgi:hypothetical protein
MATSTACRGITHALTSAGGGPDQAGSAGPGLLHEFPSCVVCIDDEDAGRGAQGHRLIESSVCNGGRIDGIGMRGKSPAPRRDNPSRANPPGHEVGAAAADQMPLNPQSIPFNLTEESGGWAEMVLRPERRVQQSCK